jgi:glutathione S-transferase
LLRSGEKDVDGRDKPGHDVRTNYSIAANGESSMYHFTALVTCLAILFYFFTSIAVSKARVRFGVKAPAISGNADFERVFRVQMNTLEWMPIFLPSLWLFAIYISDIGAAVLGLVWIAGRILYLVGYSQAAAKRSRGFTIQAAAATILWVGALGAIVWRMVHG